MPLLTDSVYTVFVRTEDFMASKNKEARLELRLKPEDKSTLEHAAEMRGVSVSSYLLSHALIAARKELDEMATLVLSNADRDLILKLMAKPPKPNAALKRAIKRYKKRYGG
jgi:uncharacterized protein (DUF1778 family)